MSRITHCTSSVELRDSSGAAGGCDVRPTVPALLDVSPIHGSLTWLQLQGARGPAGTMVRAATGAAVRHCAPTWKRTSKCRCSACQQCGKPDHSTSHTAESAVAAMQLPGSHTQETLREIYLADSLVGLILRAKEQNKKPEGRELGTDKASRRLLQLWW